MFTEKNIYPNRKQNKKSAIRKPPIPVGLMPAIPLVLILALTLTACGTKTTYQLDKTSEYTQFDNPELIGFRGTITEDGLSANYEIANFTEASLTCGIDEDATLLKEEDGHWYPLTARNPINIEEICVIIEPGSTLGQTLDWSDAYGKLGDGNYRLLKQVNQDGTPLYLYFDFTISGDQITVTIITCD